ncbi:MAG: hypothetical protein ACYDD5_00945 [Sulfuricurvum sp.]
MYYLVRNNKEHKIVSDTRLGGCSWKSSKELAFMHFKETWRTLNSFTELQKTTSTIGLILTFDVHSHPELFI